MTYEKMNQSEPIYRLQGQCFKRQAVGQKMRAHDSLKRAKILHALTSYSFILNLMDTNNVLTLGTHPKRNQTEHYHLSTTPSAALSDGV